jgi:[protein-PII] uridylyltransferase
VPGWLAGAGVPSEPGRDPRWGDLLLLVRTALHRVAGNRTNRLAADHQAAVAEAIGLRDQPGWEARDALMRDLFDVGRRVDLAVAGALDAAARRRDPPPTGPVEAGRGPLRLVDDVLLPLLHGGSIASLMALDAGGALETLVPGWEDVRGRPQRDPFHRYPVDVHLLRTVAETARLLREPDEPFAAEAARVVRDPAALLLGALLHDIGKVGAGSHVTLGVEMAGRATAELGVGGRQRDLVLFLVREHLLLSDTATRRNLGDEDLILHVAARVADQERLGMLYLLTVADALATGTAASTPWRLGLVRDLVAKVSRAFERGQMDPDRAGRLGRAEAAVRQALADRPAEMVERFLRDVPAGYLLWVTPSDAPAHLALVAPPPAPADARTHVGPGRSGGTYALTVVAADRVGLLSSIAGGLTLSGLSILTARAFTTEGGVALDAFEVRGAFEDDVGEERWDRFGSVLTDILAGRVDLPRRIRELRSHYRPPAAGIPVRVRIDQDASDFHSVVEVGGPDRIGLLHDLARTFADLRLDVHLATVATYGPRVVDVFYVTDTGGAKVDAATERTLERSLAAAAG